MLTGEPIKHEEASAMSGQKRENPEIHCNVRSCEYHSERSEHCTLPGISVCACAQCGSGKAEDESMCGSYRAK